MVLKQQKRAILICNSRCILQTNAIQLLLSIKKKTVAWSSHILWWSQNFKIHYL